MLEFLQCCRICVLLNAKCFNTDPYLIYVLSLIIGHEDICWSKANILDAKIKEFGISRIKEFNEKDILKLIEFVDENLFQRGSIGQCVVAIVSGVENKNPKLEKIILDTSLPSKIVENGSILYAYFAGTEALSLLEKIIVTKVGNNSVLAEVYKNLQEDGKIWLY